jgi:hypothetical protein
MNKGNYLYDQAAHIFYPCSYHCNTGTADDGKPHHVCVHWLWIFTRGQQRYERSAWCYHLVVIYGSSSAFYRNDQMSENITKQALVPVAIFRDDTEHGVYYYRASEVDALMAAQPAREPISEREGLLLREMRYIATISNGQVHRVAMMTLEKLKASGEAQPVRDPLTDEQINAITREQFDLVAWRGTTELNQHVARAVERAHGIGGDK